MILGLEDGKVALYPHDPEWEIIAQQTITKPHHAQVQQSVDHQYQPIAKNGIIRYRKGQQIPNRSAVFIKVAILRQEHAPVMSSQIRCRGHGSKTVLHEGGSEEEDGEEYCYGHEKPSNPAPHKTTYGLVITVAYH